MIAGMADLEEAISLQLEDKLVMHLIGRLVFAEAGPLIKQDNHSVSQTRGVCLILQRRPQPARTHMPNDQLLLTWTQDIWQQHTYSNTSVAGVTFHKLQHAVVIVPTSIAIDLISKACMLHAVLTRMLVSMYSHQNAANSRAEVQSWLTW